MTEVDKSTKVLSIYGQHFNHVVYHANYLHILDNISTLSGGQVPIGTGYCAAEAGAAREGRNSPGTFSFISNGWDAEDLQVKIYFQHFTCT